MGSSIHATCVVLGRAGLSMSVPEETGVLLLGASGAGKSDLALRLIGLGARLVSDDRTELFLQNGCLMGRPPVGLRGLFEIRGVGILQLPHIPEAEIALAVILQADPPKRLPEPEFYPLGAGAKRCPPLVRLNARECSASAKVIAAAAAIRAGSFWGSSEQSGFEFGGNQR